MFTCFRPFSFVARVVYSLTTARARALPSEDGIPSGLNFPAVNRVFPEQLLDPKQLVVFGNAVSAAADGAMFAGAADVIFCRFTWSMNNVVATVATTAINAATL